VPAPKPVAAPPAPQAIAEAPKVDDPPAPKTAPKSKPSEAPTVLAKFEPKPAPAAAPAPAPAAAPTPAPAPVAAPAPAKQEPVLLAQYTPKPKASTPDEKRILLAEGPVTPIKPRPENEAAGAPPASSGGGKASHGGDDSQDFDPGPRVMKYIGFRQTSGGSEVFVRTDGKARYRIEKQGDNRVVLELMNTKVNVRNNERALDTSYFKSAVTKVQATTTGANTRVEVDLREVVPYQVHRQGNEVALSFKGPAS
jgi:hypothetical protein